MNRIGKESGNTRSGRVSKFTSERAEKVYWSTLALLIKREYILPICIKH